MNVPGANRPPEPTTGDPGLDRELHDLIARVHHGSDADLLFDLFVSAVQLAQPGPDRLDLKIASAALGEMREAFDAFAPYRETRKVTIFGSARTRPDDPLYRQAKQLAAELSSLGWMVVTGAGPGIMQAGMEGAGRHMSFGVSIRLPFEQSANHVIVGDSKLVSMKYFFTRKLMLMKESSGFVALPGGFGTLDETFELLTLQQTGKAVPAPVVLLDVPGGSYWSALIEFLRGEVASLGYIAPHDVHLPLVTEEVSEACKHILGFFSNYRSIRWVGDHLVIRLRVAPTDAEVAALDAEFRDLCAGDGHLVLTEPLRPEVSDRDQLHLARVMLPYDVFQMSRLHELIAALNGLESAKQPAFPSTVTGT